MPFVLLSISPIWSSLNGDSSFSDAAANDSFVMMFRILFVAAGELSSIWNSNQILLAVLMETLQWRLSIEISNCSLRLLLTRRAIRRLNPDMNFGFWRDLALWSDFNEVHWMNSILCDSNFDERVKRRPVSVNNCQLDSVKTGSEGEHWSRQP